MAALLHARARDAKPRVSRVSLHPRGADKTSTWPLVSMLIAVATPRMRPPAAEWYGVKFCSASPRKEEPAASAAVACAAAAVVTKSGAASRPVASVEPARTSQLCIVLCVSLRLQADALIETLGRCSVVSHCSTVPVNIPRSMTRP